MGWRAQSSMMNMQCGKHVDGPTVGWRVAMQRVVHRSAEAKPALWMENKKVAHLLHRPKIVLVCSSMKMSKCS